MRSCVPPRSGSQEASSTEAKADFSSLIENERT
jgi:hypothetical protein